MLDELLGVGQKPASMGYESGCMRREYWKVWREVPHHRQQDIKVIHHCRSGFWRRANNINVSDERRQVGLHLYVKKKR